MRAVIQRVKGSSVFVDGEEVGTIGQGLLVFLGVATGDTEADAFYLASKTIGLRIFEDPLGKMNLSLIDIGGQMMVVSQFTLLGDCRKGRRPSFVWAAPPEKAIALYEAFVQKCKSSGIPVATGTFRAKMEVHLVNDGPVTFVIDSEKPIDGMKKREDG